MDLIEKKPEIIKRIARQKEKENYKFRSFLKGISSSKVDEIVYRLHEEITEKINCTECGNCCISLTPNVSEGEIKRLSEIKKISPGIFKEKHVEIDPFDNQKFLKDLPCIFLDNKKCSVYCDRPKVCQSFPHTHKKDFTLRTLGMINSYEICPIVFNLFEQLKKELHFK